MQRASGIPCSLFWRDNDRQSSGKSCRENADVHLLFEIELERMDMVIDSLGILSGSLLAIALERFVLSSDAGLARRRVSE